MARADKQNEEVVIRILKDGRIVIEGAGLPPRRIRELRDTLQEVLGPAQILDDERRESPEAPRLWSDLEDDETDRDRERHKE